MLIENEFGEIGIDRILERKIAGERTKAIFRQPHNHKCPGNNVIDVSIFVAECAVEGQTFELGFLIADNGNRVIKGAFCVAKSAKRLNNVA